MEIHSFKVNLGAGQQQIEGFKSVGLQLYHDIHADIAERLPFDDCSVDAAMAIHVFEHIYRWQADAVLADWCRVLKPGSMLVLELPELLRCCRNVLDGFGGARRGLWGLFGDPQYKDSLMAHKWCYSEAELREIALGAGFKRVRFGNPQFHGQKKLRDIRAECIK